MNRRQFAQAALVAAASATTAATAAALITQAHQINKPIKGGLILKFNDDSVAIELFTASQAQEHGLTVDHTHPYELYGHGYSNNDGDYAEPGTLDPWYWRLISDKNKLDSHAKHNSDGIEDPQGPYATLGDAIDDALDPFFGLAGGEAQYVPEYFEKIKPDSI